MDDTTRRVAPRREEDATDARTREIRDEIAQTRSDMSETIEAIEDRLRPSNLIAQAGDTVRTAASEKVKSMAHTAGDVAERAMDTSFAQTVRSNPIPAAMIGIGAAWLLMKGRASSSAGSYRSGTRDWRVRPGELAVGTAGYAGSASSEGSARAAEFGGEFRGYQSADYSAPRQSVNFERVVRDNPLVVGAAAALVGVAIGMSIPASDAENRLMGEARDTVMDKARETASDAADKVRNVAGEAAEAVMPERKPRTSTPG